MFDLLARLMFAFALSISDSKATGATPVYQLTSQLVEDLRNMPGLVQSSSYPHIACLGVLPKNEPAQLIEELGVDAVPTLVSHLWDNRPSNCFYMGSTFVIRRLHVSDCALLMLTKIAGRTFTKDQRPFPQSDLEEQTAILFKITSWYVSCRIIGEKHILRDGIRSGSTTSVTQALRLLFLSPNELGECIYEGIRNSKSETVRESLVKIAYRSPEGSFKRAIVMKELLSPCLKARVNGINQLDKKDAKLAVSLLRSEWKSLRLRNTPIEGEGVEDLISSLSRSDDPELVSMLLHDVDRCAINERSNIIVGIAWIRDYSSLFRKESIKTLCIETLVKLAADKSRCNFTLIFPEGTYHAPRVCDLSAMVLSSLNDNLPKISLGQSIPKRNEVITEYLKYFQNE